MTIDPFIVPIVNILVGALILIFPGMLRLLVGGYLLLVGAIWLILLLV